jgi:hypothetical protein
MSIARRTVLLRVGPNPIPTGRRDAPTMHTLIEPDLAGPATAARTRPSWQGISLIVGGCLFAVGNALHPLQHPQAAYSAATWEAAHITILFSLPFLIVGLPAIHRRLAGRVPNRLAVVPVAAAMAGLVGIGPGCVVEAFVAPLIGFQAMQDLSSGGMGVIDAAFGVFYIGGTLALGWAVRRAGIGPRGTGTLLMVLAGVLVVSMGMTGPVGGVIIIVATVLYGGSLAVLGSRA